jgi:hypothetical protein
MKKVLLIILLASLALPAQAKRLHKEKYYQDIWCTANNGVAEYVLEDNTRVDCLTQSEAVEFDFANKWAECIGQAIYYGLMTNRTPSCALIIENPDKDEKYLKRLQTVAEPNNIKIYTIKNPVLNRVEKGFMH